ncbi:hypothetical protein V8F06_008503 [Rhypophila decipiens]
MARIQLIWSWLLLFALTAWAIPIARREPYDAQPLPQPPAAWTQDLVNTLAHSPEEAELVEQLVTVLANSPEESAFLNALYSADSEPARKLAKRIQGGWVLNNGVWFYDSTMPPQVGERWIGGPLSLEPFTFKARIRRNFDVQNIWEKIKGAWGSAKSTVKNTWSNFKEVAINIFNKLNPFRKGPFIPYGANASSGTLESMERKLDEPERDFAPSMMYGSPDEFWPHQHLAAQPNGKEVDQQQHGDDGFEQLDPNVEHIEKVERLKSPPPKSHSPEIFSPRPLRVLPPIPMSEEEEQEFLNSYKDKGKVKAVPLSESGKEFELLRNKAKPAKPKTKAIPLPPPPKTQKDLEYERLAQQTRGPSPKSPASPASVLSTPSEDAAKPLYADKAATAATSATSAIPVPVSPTRAKVINALNEIKKPIKAILGKLTSPASPKVTNGPTSTDENVGRPLPTYSVADESPRKLYPFWGSPKEEEVLDPVERDFFIDPSNPFGVFQNPDPFLADLAKAEKHPETLNKFVADLENKADRLVEEYSTQLNNMQNREVGWETKGRAADAWAKALWPAEKERLKEERAERERQTGIKEEGLILPNWSEMKDKAAIKMDFDRYAAKHFPMPGAWPESESSSRSSSESGASSFAEGSASTAV